MGLKIISTARMFETVMNIEIIKKNLQPGVDSWDDFCYIKKYSKPNKIFHRKYGLQWIRPSYKRMY